jgi:hypothetical protein
MACWLLRTFEIIAIPRSVNAIGAYLVDSQAEVTKCDLKYENSSLLNSNIKS